MIEHGVYTMAEVSQYTGVKPMTLRAWFLSRSDEKGHGPVFISDYAKIENDFAVSFLNLIEVYVASFFKMKNVSHADIRRTHRILKQQLGTPHPFAHASLSTGLGRIVLESTGETQRYLEVIGRQLLFPQFADGLHRISYSATTRLADEWKLSEGITVSPMMGFGKPVIDNTGVSTLIVAKQYKANGKNAALVARLFKITEQGVLNAFRFEERLGRIAA
jgi:uncharacterized protein (DUF433 family)